MSKLLRTRVALSLVMASFTFLSAGVPGYILPAYGQAQVELRKVTPQFVTEPGCPVEVVAADTQLEVDPFGTPMAARHYIDYRNVSGQLVAAVKFRIGYVGDDGKIQLPYLNAPDGHVLQPGEQASQKWRGERVNPRTKEIKIRVLMVKMGDGSVWESAKLRETASQANGEGGEFQPLQPESAGTGWGSGGGAGGRGGDSPVVAGTPVQFSDTAKNYKSFPDRTQSGTVPLSTVQGGSPAAGFQQNAFDKGGVPMTSAPPGAGLDGGFGSTSTGAGAMNTSAPPVMGTYSGGAGAAAPAASSPGWAAGTVAPAAVAPTAVATPVAAPVSAPPATPRASDIVDPIGSIDSLLGNTKKPELPNTIAPVAPAAAAPTAAPDVVAPATAAPAAAPATVAPVAAPAEAPAAAPATVAPATAGDATPVVAPQTASPAPATSAPASDNSAGGSGAPSATPGAVDPFGN